MRPGGLFHSGAARRGALVLMLLGCCLRAVVAHAQGLGPVDRTRNAFTIDLALGERYTNNPGLAPASESVEGDFITDLRADFRAHRKSPRTEWSGRYTPFVTQYANNDQYDSSNHALDFDGRYLLTRRTQIRLLESFFYSQNPLQVGAVGVADQPVILTHQVKRWRSYSDAAFDTVLSPSLTFQAGVGARFDRYDLSPPVENSDLSGRLGMLKQVRSVDSISYTYSYSRFRFEGEDVSHTAAQEVDVAWTRKAPAPTDWMLSAGVARITGGIEVQTRYTGSALMHHPFRRLDFVSGFRQSVGSDAGVSNVTLAQNGYAGLSGKVGRRTSLGVLGEFGTRDSILVSGEELTLRYTGGQIRGDVTLNPRLSILAEARWRKQFYSAGAAEDLTVDTFLLGLVYQAF